MAEVVTDAPGPQPRPVAHAARWVAGISSIAGALPTFLLAFGVIHWTEVQVAAYGTFLGVVVGAVSVILGSRAEDQVTPVESPRDHDGIPLVPITHALPAEPVIIVEADGGDDG